MNILLINPSMFAEAFNKLRLIKREKIDDIITFTFILIKAKYDTKHLTIIIK